MIVLGIDPGIRYTGIAILEISRVHLLQVIRTNDHTNEEYQAVRDLLRVEEIAGDVAHLMKSYAINETIVECMSHTPHAAAAAKTALVHGAVMSLALQHNTPVRLVRPQETRKQLGLPRGSGKALVLEAMWRRWGTLPDVTGAPPGQWDHAHDALAVATVWLDGTK